MRSHPAPIADQTSAATQCDVDVERKAAAFCTLLGGETRPDKRGHRYPANAHTAHLETQCACAFEDRKIEFDPEPETLYDGSWRGGLPKGGEDRMIAEPPVPDLRAAGG